ncbi:acid-sensing ion channel 1C-like [Halichondria panicea]|uniref:acid-sensing ion channel 1C-like n=1 Tax=Halichondria panicea TaxID=6063 RepID=UPI00312BAE40
MTSFRKYIDNTTAHGVVRIFSGKSVIRRLFWLVIVLGATVGCLNNIIDRIIYLAGGPTATTLSLERQVNLTFPAVTVCNLNQYRKDVVDAIHPELSEHLRGVFYTDPEDVDETLTCSYVLSSISERANLTDLTLTDLSYMARDPIEYFITACYFSGRRCSHSDFTTVLTDSGYCYTFNSYKREPSLITATNTGGKAGLSVALNINQSQYVSSSSFDAGVKVVVHTQNEPPRPESTGVGVPPGSNAFIGIRQRSIIDNTQRQCIDANINSYNNFTFLTDDYSIGACDYDCLLIRVAEECNCTYIPPQNNNFPTLPSCTLSDICCVVQQQRSNIDCGCKATCSTTDYEVYNSYSAFPAMYAEEDFEELFQTTLDAKSNLLSVNVYFETLNVEMQTTSNAYGAVALLSDIGGQLGLFLGVSVISIMEFGTWIVDEVKNRLFGDKFKERKLCGYCKTSKTDGEEHKLPQENKLPDEYVEDKC